MPVREDIHQDAALWHQGQKRDVFDWDGFTRWLEADPDHRAAFDAIALLDDEVGRFRLALALPVETEPRDRRWWRTGALGALAAAAVAAISVPLLQPGEGPASSVYRTGAGEIASVVLPGGAKATLAPGTTLVAVAGKERQVRLTGAAFFDVRHDPTAPFSVEAAGFSVLDVGTRFEVSSEGGSLRVGVETGTVSVRSDRLARAVTLDAGKALLADPARGVVEVSARAADAVGGWRRGRLVYDQAPLGLVAADVSRYAGRKVVLDRGLASRRFTGVITVRPGVSAVDTLQQLTGLDARAEGSTIRLGRGAGG